MTVEQAVPDQAVPEQAVPAQRRSLGANLSALAASQAITWCLTLAWTLVVPRVIGPDQMGLLVTATSASAILGVVLGLPTRDFLTRQLVADPAGAPRLLGAALVLRTAFLPVFVLGVVCYVHATGFDRHGAAVVYLCAAATLCGLLVEPLLAGFQAAQQMQYLAYSEVVNKTLQSLGGIALVLVGLRAVGLSVYGLVAAAVLALLTARWARRVVRVDLRVDVAALVALVRSSAPYWTFGVFFMVYLWVDSVLLALLAPAEAVGWYGVATRLFTTLMFVPVIISTAWLPRLVAAFARGEEHLHAEARGPLETVVVLSLPLCVATAMTSRGVIGLLYGDAFAGAAVPLAVLACCLPPMYLNVVLNQVCVAAGRPRVWTGLMLGATVVNPALNLALVRSTQATWHNGAIGAAASLLVTEVLIAAVGTAVVGRHVVRPATARRLARALLAAGVMAGAMQACRGLGPVLAAAAGGLAFLLAARALRLASVEELDAVTATARQLLRRRPRRGAAA